MERFLVISLLLCFGLHRASLCADGRRDSRNAMPPLVKTELIDGVFVPVVNDGQSIQIIDDSSGHPIDADVRKDSFEHRQDEIDAGIPDHRFPIFRKLSCSGSLDAELEHHSNVNQLPDGQVLASEKSGASFNSMLDWNVKPKPNKNAIWNPYFGGGAGKTEYFDDVFNNRESENVSFHFGLEKKYGEQAKLLNSTFKLSWRQDWLFSQLTREVGFRTITPGVMNIFKPKVNKWGYDAIVPVVGVDLEFREYCNSLALGASGAKQDTITPQLLFLALGLKKKGEIYHKSTAMLLVRENTSKEDQQDYLDLRLSLKHSLKRNRWEFLGGIGYVQRLQENYSGQSRNDDRFEIDTGARVYFVRETQNLTLQVAWEDQSSDFKAFVYENTKTSLVYKVKF